MALYPLFFGFDGRFGRATFWVLGIPVGIVLWVAVDVGPTAWVRWHTASDLGILRFASIGAAWLLAVSIGTVAIVSSCAIAARRLHDRGKSSAWLVLFYGVPALIWIFPCQLLPDMLALLLGVADVVIVAWQFIELGFVRGSVGTNDYGPDPLLADLHARVTAHTGWALR